MDFGDQFFKGSRLAGKSLIFCKIVAAVQEIAFNQLVRANQVLTT